MVRRMSYMDKKSISAVSNLFKKAIKLFPFYSENIQSYDIINLLKALYRKALKTVRFYIMKG